MNLDIRIRPLAGSRLVEEYLAESPRLAPFFPGSPFSPQAYRRKADAVRERFSTEALLAMAPAVRPLNQDARDRLDAVVSGNGFFVTTGQQPGLFGGPLYGVHKTLSAVALARRLETVLDAPVLPLFWIASDDHDWTEANHAHVLDLANELRRLELRGDAEPHRSLGRRTVDGAAETALSELMEALPPSEFTPRIIERLRTAYTGTTVAGAYARTLADLFADLPVALVDAQDPVVRALARPVILRELEHAEAHERAFAEQTSRLEAAGFACQVPVLPGASNVFHEDEEHGRERLVRSNGSWVLRASRRRLTEAELWSAFEASPERFSANVVLRPVVESALFPTLAYVGGPGEVSYLAQTGCLFRAHEVEMPLVFPRLSVTLVEGKVKKVLDKFALTVEDFVRPAHELVAEAVREDVPEEVREAVAAMRESLERGYAGIYEAARAIDETLQGPIVGARNEGLKALSEVEKKIRHHVKLQNETGLEQLEKATVNLAPEGKPQERVLNVHQYLARYGPDLLPAILERMEVKLESDGAGWAGAGCE